MEVSYTAYSKMLVTLEESLATIDDQNRGVFFIQGSQGIDSGKIRYKVSKEWIDIKNIDPDSVTLKKIVEDNWVSMPSAKISEDAFDAYYETEFTTFGTFAIVGQVRSQDSQDEDQQTPGIEFAYNTSDNESWIEEPEKEDSFNLFLYLGLIVIMIAGLVAAFYISANKKVKGEKAKSEEKKIRELKEFIQVSVKNGMSKEEIRQKLVNAGWNREVINIYLK